MGNLSSHSNSKAKNLNPKSKVRKPAKIHTNDELFLGNPSKLDLLKLPLRWREKVWAMVDDETKKLLRQVCRELKHEIDQSAGLYVMINSGIQENMDFVQSVKVKWATIDIFNLDQHQKSHPDPPKISSSNQADEEIQIQNENPESRRNFLKYPDSLEGLQIFSQISTPLFTSLIEPSLKNLKSLIFQGESLTSSNLSSSYTRGAVLDFPALKHLAIEYDVNYDERSQLDNLGYNMIFILSSFHCPVLETFQLEPLMLQTQSQPQQQFLHGLSHASQIFNWENEFLKRFVQAHRQTLKNLCIFFHEFTEIPPQIEDVANGNEPNDLNNNQNNNNQVENSNTNDSENKFPLNLAHYSIRCTMSHPGPSPPDQLYWKRILEEQKQLESFVIRAELWHDLATTFKIMDRVIQKNSSSLRDICIGSVFRESKVSSIYDFRVDFGIFSSCCQLVSLDLYSSDEMHHMADFGSESNANDPNSQNLGLSLCFLGKNLIQLPKTLKYLKINGISLKSDEIQSLEFHESLEKITLVNCGRSGAVGVNYSALMALLRNETITRYVFCGFNLDTDSGLLEDFIKKKNNGVFSHDIVIYKSYGKSDSKQKEKEKEKEKEGEKNKELSEIKDKDKLSTGSTIQIDPDELCPDRRSKSRSRAAKEEKTTGCFPWSNSNSNSKSGQTPRSNGNNKTKIVSK